MKPHMNIVFVACCAAWIPVLAAEVTSEQPSQEYHVLTSYVVGEDGGWDLLTMDPAGHRLFVARVTRVMVIDTDTGKIIGEIPGSGVHGIALVAQTNRGFITNGKDNNVTVFNLKTLDIIGKIATGTKPDAIAYDRTSKQLFVCNNGGTDLTVINPEDGYVNKTIEVGGSPELIAIDENGRLYTNLEDKNEVAVIDTIQGTLIAHWPLAPGAGPSGIAVDALHHRIFSACRESKTLEILNADTGSVIASPATGSGTDGAIYNPSCRNIFCSNGDGTLTVIHEDDENTFQVVQTVKTRAGARTIALDSESHRLYLVTADRKPDVMNDPANHEKPQYVPNTFTVLVVGR